MMMSDADEEAKEPVWVYKLRSLGPIPLQNDLSSSNTNQQRWCSPPPHIFLVRGPHYFSQKSKIPAGPCLLQPLAFDWFKGSHKIHQILRNPNCRVTAALESDLEASTAFVWAFNLQISSREQFSAIAYFVSLEPVQQGSLVDRFLKEDDAFRNSRLKLIANIVEGPWIVRTAVGEQAICILGRALSCKYYHGHNFMEVDVDIGSSIIANAIVHVALGYVTTLTVDLAFLIEGQDEEELPEKILGTVRFANLDPAAAQSIDSLEGGDGCKNDEGDISESEYKSSLEDMPAPLTSRLWKSFSTYINGEEEMNRNGEFPRKQTASSSSASSDDEDGDES